MAGIHEYQRPSDRSAGHVHNLTPRPTVQVSALYLGPDPRIGYGNRVRGYEACGGLMLDLPDGELWTDGADLWDREVTVTYVDTRADASAPIMRSI